MGGKLFLTLETRFSIISNNMNILKKAMKRKSTIGDVFLQRAPAAEKE
jgi:hypothetical protein